MLKAASANMNESVMISSRAEAGEVDTRSPFQSVKDAVCRFNGNPSEKSKTETPKLHSAERAAAKETRLHLASKEFDRLMQHIMGAENTKSVAMTELRNAKLTVNFLTDKLRTVNESKVAALEATKLHSGKLPETDKAWRKEADQARAQYTITTTELDAKKQVLAEVRRNIDEIIKQKVDSDKQVEQANAAEKMQREKTYELSKKISSIRNSFQRANCASMLAQEEIKRIYDEKDAQRVSYRSKLTELERKYASLKENRDPGSNLKQQLAEKTDEVSKLQREIEEARGTDISRVRRVGAELEEAKEKIKSIADEEGLMRKRAEVLKVELESLRMEHSLLKEKEAETESIAVNLQIKLRNSQAELEAFSSQLSNANSAFSALHHVVEETENAKRAAESARRQADMLNIEAEILRVVSHGVEEVLAEVVRDAEEAKDLEAKAAQEVKLISEKMNAARISTESGSRVSLSRDEYETLRRKGEELGALAEMKVGAALAQVKAVRASEKDTMRRLEMVVNEVSEIKAATEEALKGTEMAEAAKRAVEGELQRRREAERKGEMEMVRGLEGEKLSFLKGVATVEGRKLDKEKLSFSKKALLPTLGRILYRKKRQVKGDAFGVMIS